jgi:NADH-quinone oxidoreductase subunit H
MFHVVPWLWPFLWFMLKLSAMLFVYIWVRATLPRFRYDRLMHFGWKVLIPIGLAWVLFTGIVVVLPDLYGKWRFFKWAAIVFGAGFVVSLLWPMVRPRRATEGATP